MTARRLLHIEASPRGVRSRSGMVAADLLAALPGTAVESFNVFDADLPPLSGAAIDARYALIEGRAVPAADAAAWERIGGIVRHLLSFDIWLFSVPMWNFGIPYRLKHYIDLVTQPGLAFSVEASGGVIGHAAGRTAVIVAAGALDTSPGSVLAGLDHQVAYLDSWLRFIGVGDIHVVRVQPTYGAPEVVEAAMARGYAEAAAVAAAINERREYEISPPALPGYRRG